MPGTTATPAQRVQASCLRWHGRGILIRGNPGSGKSTLLAELLLAGGWLVADDLVRLERTDTGVIARAVARPALGGPSALIEIRGSGIFRAVSIEATRLHCCVDLATPGEPFERLPAASTINVLGWPLTHLRLGAGGPLAARILVALTAPRAA